MSYEYKCVGAPEKARRIRGARTRTDRVAGAMEELINEEAVNGWEYLRTDLVPVEEKAGFFSRAQEVHRAVLVFRRATVLAAPAQRHAPQQPAHQPAEAMMHHPEPEHTEQPLRLSADMESRRAPRPSPGRRPPSGLG